VIPLWALHIGLDPQTTSIIFGLSGAVDMLLFYPAGSVMDRLGRKWVAVPSMFVLGLAHLLLPLTHTVVTLTLVALLMGIGNGLGAGVIMTLGADASPPSSWVHSGFSRTPGTALGPCCSRAPRHCSVWGRRS
jgi:MFS family permease